MNRICKLALGGMHTPQPSDDLAEGSQSGGFTIFDPPRSTGTFPSAIMANGVVIGSYSDASGLTHGFLRSKNGSFTTIDVPGAQVTTPTAINPGGVITGWYCPTVDCQIGGTITIGGFLQAPDGTFTTFTPPSGGYVLGSIYTLGGPPPSINPAGDIAGTYVDPSFGERGFLRTKNGAFTTIDFPGASFTEALAINPAGVIVGDFCNATACYHGFQRSSDGIFTDINANAGIPTGINPAGAITGGAYDGTGGYLWSPDGSFITFNPPGSQGTTPFAINPAGTITGGYFESGAHGFLRAPDGTITTFDPPGSTATAGTAINPGGVPTS